MISHFSPAHTLCFHPLCSQSGFCYSLWPNVSACSDSSFWVPRRSQEWARNKGRFMFVLYPYSDIMQFLWMLIDAGKAMFVGHWKYIFILMFSILYIELELVLGYLLGRQCPKQGSEQSFVQKEGGCSRGFLNTVVEQAGECCFYLLKPSFCRKK